MQRPVCHRSLPCEPSRIASRGARKRKSVHQAKRVCSRDESEIKRKKQAASNRFARLEESNTEPSEVKKDDVATVNFQVEPPLLNGLSASSQAKELCGHEKTASISRKQPPSPKSTDANADTAEADSDCNNTL
ncbi:hypothetical protein ElyMa_005724900 [Elysia marginata]|uniref:BZIP domain-containing protein n=1 Tax=Elysia marginata TaxID=1093978 RepID=A0AAV4FJ10_9GAST|nr:hypothetical protein ElyMa_005724900 [Elysia marginata]